MSWPDDETVFPNNIVNALQTALITLDPPDDSDPTVGTPVYRRALRTTDGLSAMGVFPADWTPTPGSMEIGGVEPTLQMYRLAIQALITDADEDRGLATHAAMSRRIRVMLARDPALRVILGTLRVDDTEYNCIERTGRWGVSRQVFLSNELSGSFLYLSTIEFWLETEKT